MKLPRLAEENCYSKAHTESQTWVSSLDAAPPMPVCVRVYGQATSGEPGLLSKPDLLAESQEFLTRSGNLGTAQRVRVALGSCHSAKHWIFIVVNPSLFA